MKFMLPGGQEVDPEYLVSDRTFVLAKTGPGSPHGIGRVISYTDRPTFVIERPDGTRFSWIASMCRPALPDQVAAMLHAELDTKRLAERSTEVTD